MRLLASLRTHRRDRVVLVLHFPPRDSKRPLHPHPMPIRSITGTVPQRHVLLIEPCTVRALHTVRELDSPSALNIAHRCRSQLRGRHVWCPRRNTCVGRPRSRQLSGRPRRTSPTGHPVLNPCLPVEICRLHSRKMRLRSQRLALEAALTAVL